MFNSLKHLGVKPVSSILAFILLKVLSEAQRLYCWGIASSTPLRGSVLPTRVILVGDREY